MMFPEIKRKVLNHQDITNEEALYLFEIEDKELLQDVFDLANYINEEQNGNVVSFVHNMNINFTNVCELHCTFCAFRRNGNEEDAFVLSEEGIVEKVRGKGITEITYQGGLTDRVPLEKALSLLRAVKDYDREIHCHAFSPEEIAYYSEKTGKSYREVIADSIQSGMDSMCGTAAEILDDEIRAKVCPTKINSDTWIEIIKCGHELGLHSTSTILFGHIEEPKHWVRHLNRIRDLQKETGMITEFIPLLFMPDNAPLGRVLERKGIEQDRSSLQLRMLAVSRIYFQNTIRNIQTSWVKMGLDFAIQSLQCGANDVGGTLYSETITRNAGGTHGEYVSVDAFEQRIEKIGKVPIQRDTVYSFQKSEESHLLTSAVRGQEIE